MQDFLVLLFSSEEIKRCEVPAHCFAGQEVIAHKPSEYHHRLKCSSSSQTVLGRGHLKGAFQTFVCDCIRGL